MLSTFPTLEQESGQKLAGHLGSFWSELYSGADVIARFCSARGWQSRANINDLLVAVDCLSRRRAPLIKKEAIRLLSLRRGDQKPFIAKFGAAGVLFGDGGTYGGQRETDLWAWELPTDLVEVGAIANRLASPEYGNADQSQIVWTSGVDYTVDVERGLLVFRHNPFDNADIAVSPNLDDDDDDIVNLWMLGAAYAVSYVSDMHDIVGLPSGTTEHHRLAVCAAVDCIMRGPTRKSQYEMIEAIFGLPLCKGVETVEVVSKNTNGYCIVTDKNVYKSLDVETISVAVGDILSAGDTFTPVFKVYDLRTGDVPVDLTEITIPNKLLLGDFAGDLTFTNTDVPLVVETDSDGFTEVSFEIDGSAADVALFWSTTHANGKAEGRTLAHLLDTRTNKSSEPTADNLPATVNPAEFVVKNVLRNNAVLVKIDEDYIPDTALGLSKIDLLEYVVPPHVVVLVQSI